jgi:hypothetical protein
MKTGTNKRFHRQTSITGKTILSSEASLRAKNPSLAKENWPPNQSDLVFFTAKKQTNTK